MTKVQIEELNMKSVEDHAASSQQVRSVDDPVNMNNEIVER